MIDILFLTLPRLELRSPITAPAILKASVESKGYTAYCYDLNLDLWHNIDAQSQGHIWFDTDLTFRYEEKFKDFWNMEITKHVQRWADVIRIKNPKWIGFTIFSQRSKWISLKLCEFLRKEFSNIKIVAGGPYCEFVGPLLFNKKLIDAYVVGEGEHAIIDILRNNLNAPGINGNKTKQIDDLDQIPIPDYSDFNLDKYPKTWYDPRIKDGTKMGTDFIYITGSRGCVRKCEFCDIQNTWPKFRYRSGKNIAEEIRIQNSKYGSKKFLFTDSLLNGSVKQLKDLCETLIQYKNEGKITSIQWQGQFIARPKNQMNEDMYKLLKEAGCFFVSIGVESGSQQVRNDMKKMFSDEDLDFTFNMCSKYGIQMAWLLLVGYPTETEEEFQKTLNMLEKYQWINKLGLIKSIALGPTLDIVPGSPLYNKQKELGITWDQHNNWIYKNNTRETRILRWLRLKEKCIELKYPVVEKATEHLLIELNKYSKEKIRINNVYDHYNENLGNMGPTL